MAGFAEYEDYDGLGLAELVRRREVSPVDLVEAAIERIEALNPVLNAVVHKNYERARQQAAGDLPAGPFTGVPFLLKDLMAEDAGEPSTASCRALRDWRAPRDCELVARYKHTGVVILGRTNTPEFGIYGVTEPELRGPARNPWDTGLTPGGSSGGSAAAVAARMVALAHGGDGGGSIRIPASHCGLVGLKPTRARTPIGPYYGEAWAGLVCEHVISRSVRDSAAMLDATQGPDTGAPYQTLAPERPFLDEVGREPGRLRVAFCTDALFGDTTHPDCILAVREAAALAEELGHHVEEARPAFDRDLLTMAYFTVVCTEIAALLRSSAERSGRVLRAGDVEKPTWFLRLIGEKLKAHEYIAQRQAIYREARRVAAFFQEYDVLLTPTVASLPLAIGALALKPLESLQIDLLRALPLRPLLLLALQKLAKTGLAATPNTMLFNQTGQPAISLPLYWNATGLPIGTQWVGRFGDEATLFRLASQLERARPWGQRKPVLLQPVA